MNLGKVQAAIDAELLDAAAAVDAAALVKAGLMRRAKDGVRLLGDGELKAKVEFRGVRRLEVGRGRGREGRRLGQDPGTEA